MQPEEIKQLIEAGIPGSEATVKSDGSHYEAVVVSSAFEGQSTLNEQRMVYATLGDAVTSGAIHAINIKTYTPQEWKITGKMQVS
ncbi:MAG: BolA family transcriptional regulator [Gammaproteobacteria bacterium]|nr:BolA family transcriptional regulator [Gammaproteobacteria bacterium]